MLTQEVLKELLHYNPDSGVFTWKFRDRKWFSCEQAYKAWNAKYPITRAGSIGVRMGKRYCVIRVLSKAEFAHRLAHLYVNGGYPSDEVDHINGDGTDNRRCNFREVNHRDNHLNQKLHSNNTSGCSGVHWCKRTRRWKSVIRVNYRKIYLGVFIDKFDAICVRKSAEIKYNFHPNHGQVRPL